MKALRKALEDGYTVTFKMEKGLTICTINTTSAYAVTPRKSLRFALDSVKKAAKVVK